MYECMIHFCDNISGFRIIDLYIKQQTNNGPLITRTPLFAKSQGPESYFQRYIV